MADDFYSMAEAATYLSNKMGVIETSLGAYATHYEDLMASKGDLH
jgi:hypothetical protein